MAKNFYIIDRSQRYGADVNQLATSLAQSVAKMQDLANVAANMNDGTDYTLVESQFGLQAGQGANLVFLLANTLAKLQDPVIAQFIAYLGGVIP